VVHLANSLIAINLIPDALSSTYENVHRATDMRMVSIMPQNSSGVSNNLKIELYAKQGQLIFMFYYKYANNKQ